MLRDKNMNHKIKMTLSAFTILLGITICFSGIANAQNAPLITDTPVNEATTISSNQNTQEINQEVNTDENVSASDLGVKNPTLLPDSPFYFLKNWARGIQSFFTFNPVKKLELKSKFANERLIEIKKLSEEKKSPKIIEKATKEYENELDGIKKDADRIKEKAEKDSELNKFLDKWTKQQFLQQKLLERLENQVAPQAFKKIKEAREKHLERFKDVMLKLENKNDLPKRLEKAVENQKGSRFRGIKALEILKNLEDKVPENAKDVIKKAREQVLKNIQKRLEKMPEKRREMLKNYINKISGCPLEHMRILQDITSIPQLKGLKEKVIEKLSRKIERKAAEKGCPKWIPPTSNFCPNGRIVIEKSNNNCPLPPKCVPFYGIKKIRKKIKIRNNKCFTNCIIKYSPNISSEVKSCIEKSDSFLTAEKCLRDKVKTDIQKEKIRKCMRSCSTVIMPLAHCKPVCMAIGTKNEGWYNSCTKKLIKYANCKNKTEYKKKEHSDNNEKYCATLWDPVCGENGKTYSNECFAKTAGIKILHTGPCKKNINIKKQIKIIPKKPKIVPKKFNFIPKVK